MEKYEKEKHIAFGYIYRDKLKKWLLEPENIKVMFSIDNQADSWCDFLRFPTSKSDRNHLCLPNEPFLVDRKYEGVHTYCICTLSEKGRITNEFPVMPVSDFKYGEWRNGYFLLPKLD